jgi:hypothetical protein
MSSTIQDIDIKKIHSSVNDFISELDNMVINGDDIIEYESIFKKKYKFLVSTSESLYKMIYDQYKMKKFDKAVFMKNLNMMLSALEDIQKMKLSQYDASCNVGEVLASQFIPQLKK